MALQQIKLPKFQEALVVGGFSLIVFFFLKLTSNLQTDDSTSWFIYYFSFVVNFPHFLVSYQLLYWDSKEHLFSKPRFLVASVIAPGILLGILSYGLFKPDIVTLGHTLNAMYFFVGWHYIKQTFGVVSVCNSHEKIYFNKQERFAVKGFLYSIWAMSWVALNSTGSEYQMEGIPYRSFQFSPVWMSTAYTVLAAFALLGIYLGYQKYIREGRVISWSGLISIAALLCWYLPTLHNPTFFLVVPLFHSLQYLYFVYLMKTHEAVSGVPKRETPEDRRTFFRMYYGYLAWPFITGAVFMWFLPRYLDQTGVLSDHFKQAAPFMFAFTVFINIHHYFIDHAIWRHDNPKMKKYLF